MKSGRFNLLFSAFLAWGLVVLMGGAGLSRSSARDRHLVQGGPAQSASPASGPGQITIDYPLDGSVFPPEITAPTFLWRDGNGSATRWRVEISFAGGSDAIRADAAGEPMQMGEIDPRAGSAPQLTPEQAATHTWTPDENTWAKIKRGSVKAARIAISGYAESKTEPVSRASVTISTSVDPVGAPIFYRDVPLMLSPPAEHGAIQPLPPSAIPLIQWRLRNIGEPESRTVMKDLPTCANCHSFSRDGKTLGLDLDGPKNDKGLYAVVPVLKNTTIRNKDVIRWSSFQEHLGARSSEPTVKRFGFMSQISPDGQYVVTSIGPPAAGNVHKNEHADFAPGLSDRLFSMNYRDIAFTQVFYPTRGILAWYDRRGRKLRALPGANDPNFVQTSAFWSPDGKYLVFSRAQARDPYPAGSERPEYANDPREPQIQYDLYRIPFNEGRGGKAEPIKGASGNGMSNNFPKVSPDGRWIVFVQNRNGLLMRPDSRLYIVPFAGGKARLMKCNTPLMNSWHTFSPNGRWLAFSSKARPPYTRLMLTHIDAEGNDTPAILVDNTTAANRAVNIPEFVNVDAGGLENIDPQATEFYRLFNQAFELMESNQMGEAIGVLRSAVQREPDDALAHYALATALTGNDQERDALNEYRRACTLNPTNAAWFAHLAVSEALTGDLQGAVASSRKALALNPSEAGAETDLGTLLFDNGQTREGYEHMRKAVAMAPDFALGHFRLGVALAKKGRLEEAGGHLQKAVGLDPESTEYRFNLGVVQAMRGDAQGAVSTFQKAVELSGGKDAQSLTWLAEEYSKTGHAAEAAQTAQQALALAVREHDEELQKKLRGILERGGGDAPAHP